MVPFNVTSAVAEGHCGVGGVGRGAGAPSSLYLRSVGHRFVGFSYGINGLSDVVPLYVTELGRSPCGVGGVSRGAPSSLDLRSADRRVVGIYYGIDGVRDVVPLNVTSAVGKGRLWCWRCRSGAPSSLDLRSVGYRTVGIYYGIDDMKDVVPLYVTSAVGEGPFWRWQSRSGGAVVSRSASRRALRSFDLLTVLTA